MNLHSSHFVLIALRVDYSIPEYPRSEEFSKCSRSRLSDLDSFDNVELSMLASQRKVRQKRERLYRESCGWWRTSDREQKDMEDYEVTVQRQCKTMKGIFDRARRVGRKERWVQESSFLQ